MLNVHRKPSIPKKVRKIGNKANKVLANIANSLADIADITHSLANSLANSLAHLWGVGPRPIAGLFDADPRYEPLPSVFPGPNRHWNWAEGEPPPWPPLGFVLLVFLLILLVHLLIIWV